MNTNQVKSAIRAVMLLVGTFLIAKGKTAEANLISSEEFIGALLDVAAFIWSMVHHADEKSSPAGVAKLLACFLGVSVLTGCAHYKAEQEVTTKDGITRKQTVSGYALWDASNVIAKMKATNSEKSQSTGLEGIDQSASSTNLTAQAGYVLKGLEILGRSGSGL